MPKPHVYRRKTNKKKDCPEARLDSLVKRSIAAAYPGHAYIRKTHPDVYEESGKPDFVGHIMGIHIEIEDKVSANYISGKQKAQISHVNKTGGFAIAMIHDRKDDTYWMVMPDAVQSFSYKNREGWVKLSLIEYEGRSGKSKVLNLQPMTILLASRILALKDLLHANPETHPSCP